jgi:hypothetical protein
MTASDSRTFLCVTGPLRNEAGTGTSSAVMVVSDTMHALAAP